jgi:hypothetical protein
VALGEKSAPPLHLLLLGMLFAPWRVDQQAIRADLEQTRLLSESLECAHQALDEAQGANALTQNFVCFGEWMLNRHAHETELAGIFTKFCGSDEQLLMFD